LVTDTAGNTKTVTDTLTLNTVNPTLSSTTLPAVTTTAFGGSGDAGTRIGVGDTVVLTITFDTAVNGLTSGTINTIFTIGSAVNATWSGSDGTNTRVLTYTIVANDNGVVTIDEAKLKTALLAANITDLAGNDFVNTSSIADITANLPTVDTDAPTLAITNSKTSGVPKVGEEITYTFTFSEVVTNFVVGDIAINNGAIKLGTGLVPTTSGGDAGKVYTLVVVPVVDTLANTNMTVTVDANKVIDVAGNSNTAATHTQAIDMPPMIKSAAIDSGNTNVVLTLSENITGTPDNGDFVVEVLINGAWVANAVTNIALNNDTVTLTLTSAIEDNPQVRVVYTQNSDTSKQLKDDADNAFASITVKAEDNTVATLNIQMDDTDLTRGETATVTFTFSEALGGEVVNTVTQGSSGWTDLTTSGVADTAIITGLDALKNTSTGELYDVSRLIKSSVLDNTWIVGGIDNGKARFFVVELHNKSGGGIEYKAFSLYNANDSLISTLATTTDFESAGWNKVNANTYTATGLKVGSFNLDDITAPNGTISNLIPSDSDATVYTATFTPDNNVDSSANSNVISVGTGWTDTAGNPTTNTTNSSQYTIKTDAGIGKAIIAIQAGEDAYVGGAETDIHLEISAAGMIAGDTIQLKLGASALGNVYTVTASDITAGKATISVSIASLGTDGDKFITAVVTTATGSINSEASDAITLKKDTTAPTFSAESDSTANSLNEYANLVINFNENIKTSGGTVEIWKTGATSATETITISNSDINDKTLTINPTGALDEGAYYLKMATGVITDMIGNASAGIDSSTWAFSIDTTAPATPTVTTAKINGEGSVTINTGSLTNGIAYLVKNDAIASGTTITQVLLNGLNDNKVNLVAITSNTTVINAVGLLEGNYQVYVADKAGNVSAASNGVITIDTIAPVASAWSVKGDTATFKNGDVIEITLTSSETVKLANIGTNKIVIGGKDFMLTGANDDETTSLVFKYTVLSGDNINPADFGIDAGGITLTGVTDEAGNAITGISNAVAFSIDAPVTANYSIGGSVTSSNGVYTKSGTNSWNADVFSDQGFTGDGFVVAKFDRNDKSIMIGLSSDDSNNSYTTIDYAIYGTSTGTIEIYESSTIKLRQAAGFTYNAGDYFKVAREGTVVKYYVIPGAEGSTGSGTLVYTSTVASNAATKLYLDSSFYGVGAQMSNLQIVQPLPFSIDAIAPTLSIKMDDTDLKTGETTTVTFTFSEAVKDFNTSDIDAPNGTISNLQQDASNATVYTATFTPTANKTDNSNVITVGQDWTDIAGNAPAAVTSSANYEMDATPPVDSAAPVLHTTTQPAITNTGGGDSIGDTVTLTLTFDKAVKGLNSGSVTGIFEFELVPLSDIKAFTFKFTGASISDTVTEHTVTLAGGFVNGSSIWVVGKDSSYAKAVKVQVTIDSSNMLSFKTVQSKYMSWSDYTAADKGNSNPNYFESQGTTNSYHIKDITINGVTTPDTLS
ncbi:MAG: hypothetical protein FE834_01325, partial [Gammaproteobacteria bacterium]|nr:hypothetical protein [Gammaproteobacteria bacterium]